jgi:hypothetical protein
MVMPVYVYYKAVYDRIVYCIKRASIDADKEFKIYFVQSSHKNAMCVCHGSNLLLISVCLFDHRMTRLGRVQR